MHAHRPAAMIVVGVDGSQSAVAAATWAAGEAASRDIPLKLVNVIYNTGLLGSEPADAGDDTDVTGTAQLAAARAALLEAQRAAETAAAAVKVEIEVLWGNPLATLIALSRSATMVAVGSIGLEHSCHRAGSTAAALAGSAGCPVAVIHRRDPGRRADGGYIVAELDTGSDNNAVLGWAMAEAKLRGAPLRVITASGSEHPPDRQIEHWARRYPGVAVEPIALRDGLAEYLADCMENETDSVQLFVSGSRDRRSLGWSGDAAGCSVLTVGAAQL